MGMTNRSDELMRALLAKGYPEELCSTIAYKYMNTDFTATRMLGYLYRVESPSEEQVVDEMLAILSDRDRIMKKHEMEATQAKINQMYEENIFGE